MTENNVSLPKKILIASRPWSFPASTMPVVFGTVAAITVGRADFNPLYFIMALLGMVLLHSGANVLSDVNDYKKGLDTEVTPVSGAIVRQYFNTRQGMMLGLAMMAAGCGLGLILVYLVGLPVLYIGVIGVIIGGFYTVPPLSLKYHALGDFAVFTDFGILGALGAWTVQTGSLSYVPALWVVPIAMLIAGILHGNNWRDIQTDSKGGVSTVASLLGDKGSLYYYAFLIFGPFVFVAGMIILTNLFNLNMKMPVASLIVLLALPAALKLWRRAKNRRESDKPENFILLDKGTADLNLIFGCLYTVSLLIGSML